MTLIGLLRCYATLIRWLGPWASPQSIPSGVCRTELTIEPRTGDEPEIRVWVYTPEGRPPIGSYLLLQGLHFAGPADPRFERFSRILAKAGLLIFTPFLPDYLELTAVAGVIRDADRAFAALMEYTERPRARLPGIFSISFGSLPALRLAASPERSSQVGGLMLFGGYADWKETASFCLTGELNGVRHTSHDPLDAPIIFINLLDAMPEAPDDKPPLVDAWKRYVKATWGRPEMRPLEGRAPIARQIAATLPEASRKFFLQGCLVEPGGVEIGLDALARGGPRWEVLDPRPHLSSLTCPVYIAHGIDDDVIPYTQLDRIREALPSGVPVTAHLTGLYGHTSRITMWHLLKRIPMMVREIWIMMAMLRAIVRAATHTGR